MSVLLHEHEPAPLEIHRVELTGFCYRMVASAFVAEDVVQETLLLASLRPDRFSTRSDAERRVWLYRVATSVCLDVLRGAAPRVLPTSSSGPVPDQLVLPVPDDHVLDAGG